MTRKRPFNLRREVRELRDEIARLRAELAAARVPVLPAPTAPAPQPWDTYPGPFAGGCRWSGACNCVRYDRMPWCGDSSLSACTPLDTTLRIAPGTARMVPAWNAGACTGGLPVTAYNATSAAQPVTVHVENTAGCAPGAGVISIFP